MKCTSTVLGGFKSFNETQHVLHKCSLNVGVVADYSESCHLWLFMSTAFTRWPRATSQTRKLMPTDVVLSTKQQCLLVDILRVTLLVGDSRRVDLVTWVQCGTCLQSGLFVSADLCRSDGSNQCYQSIPPVSHRCCEVRTRGSRHWAVCGYSVVGPTQSMHKSHCLGSDRISYTHVWTYCHYRCTVTIDALFLSMHCQYRSWCTVVIDSVFL